MHPHSLKALKMTRVTHSLVSACLSTVALTAQQVQRVLYAAPEHVVLADGM